MEAMDSGWAGMLEGRDIDSPKQDGKEMDFYKGMMVWDRRHFLAMWGKTRQCGHCASIIRSERNALCILRILASLYQLLFVR